MPERGENLESGSVYIGRCLSVVRSLEVAACVVLHFVT